MPRREINELLCAAALGVFIGIVLRDIEAQQILMLYKLDEGSTHLVEAQSAAARHVHRGEILLRNGIDIQVQNESRASACTCASASCAALPAPLD